MGKCLALGRAMMHTRVDSLGNLGSHDGCLGADGRGPGPCLAETGLKRRKLAALMETGTRLESLLRAGSGAVLEIKLEIPRKPGLEALVEIKLNTLGGTKSEALLGFKL